jgi:hypothetical protein
VTRVEQLANRRRSAPPSQRAARPGMSVPVLRIAALRGAGLLRTHSQASVHGVRHTTLHPTKAGLPVLNRSVRLHERDGQLIGWSGRASFPSLREHGWTLDEDAAVERSLQYVGASAPRASVDVRRGWFAGAEGTLSAWQVIVPAWRPLATWQVRIDAHTGELLQKTNLLLSATGVGAVFREDPVSSGVVTMESLDDLSDNGFLQGAITNVFDLVGTEAFRPDLVFDFAESDPRFVQTSVYRAVTDTGRFAESHGFPAFGEPVITFTNLRDPTTGGEFNNAFYDPFFQLLLIGNGDGNLTANLGTDFDVPAHELGHHIFQTMVDPGLVGSPGALGAVNEGVADTIAALVLQDPEIGEAVIPGQPFLRNVNNSAIFPNDSSSDPHIEGLIYAGLNWELASVIGISPFSDILIAGLPFLPIDEFLPHDYRNALVSGDLVVTGGQNGALIRSLSTARGLDFFEDLGFAGFVEEGIPSSGFLADADFDIYLFSEFPDSSEIRFTLTGTGDADLLVTSLAFFDPDDPSTFLFSGNAFTSNEFIRLDRSTLPSVDSDDFWLVVVEDFPNFGASSYTLNVAADLPAARISIGGSLTDDLSASGEVDLLTFNGAAGQIVRLEATASPSSPDLDLAVAIFEPLTIEIFGSDDDSGPGADALIQGAVLPVNGTYGIAVFSPIADIDPTVGTGTYQLDLSACVNSGPDLDGDGLAEACDDDDDGDGFRDATDSAPNDPLLCQDAEGDGCDDCVSGVFDPFDDGLDTDGDASCDLGDLDDDNDGCEDSIDSSPLSASVDDDLDFVGAHCDNCPDDFNPSQIDQDDDGLGDVCDPTPTPEPGASAQALVALGVVGLLRWRRRLAPASS